MTRTRLTGTGRSALRRMARIAALPWLALAFPVVASAQAPGSVQDYRLPPASPSPKATAAGPVDSDHPVVTAPATPRPTPAPAPTIVVPPPATSTPTPSAQGPATTRTETAAPRQAPRTSAPAPAAQAPMAPAPAATIAAEPALPATSEPTPTAASLPGEPERAPAQTSHWPWLAGGAALLLLLGAALLWSRRKADDEALEYLSPPPPEPEPGPPAVLAPPHREPAPSAPAPVPAPARADPRPLEMELEARHLSRAMINATLAYRLTLTNRADQPTGPLRIAGDIVSAHASLSAEEQLAPGNAALETIHEVPSLAPGEAVSLRGELRLPIASILPIQSGGSRVFVPLARFRAETEGGNRSTRVFVVGQASERPGGALRPFPLDRGPGVERGLGQRELEMPA